jgi:PGF-pre-PGF domain-containing protein
LYGKRRIKELKQKSGRREEMVLLPLFVLLVTSAFLAGTVTVVQGAEVGGVTRYAPAGLAPYANFDVTLTISGDVPLVVGIVETIPKGFNFKSTTHPLDQYNVSSVSGQDVVAFAVIGKKEITYRVEAPSSGKGTFTGTWTDMLSENGGKVAGTTVTVGVSDEIVSGGGSSAKEVGVTPTPAVPTVKKASREVPIMEAGTEVAMVFDDMDVALIALKADTDVNDVKVEVERVEQSAGIPEPSGIAYAFLEIEVENTEGAQIEGRIECKVLKSWIADNTIDETTVTLSRFDEAEGWQVLATSIIGEDNDFVYFEAVTPSFSLFAITGERAAAGTLPSVVTPTATPGTMQIPNPAATPLPVPTAPPPLATTTPTSEVPGFGAIFTAVSLLIACLFVVVLRTNESGGLGK